MGEEGTPPSALAHTDGLVGSSGSLEGDNAVALALAIGVQRDVRVGDGSRLCKRVLQLLPGQGKWHLGHREQEGANVGPGRGVSRGWGPHTGPKHRAVSRRGGVRAVLDRTTYVANINAGVPAATTRSTTASTTTSTSSVLLAVLHLQTAKTKTRQQLGSLTTQRPRRVRPLPTCMDGRGHTVVPGRGARGCGARGAGRGGVETTRSCKL